MAQLRIFSYLPNPRLWKATITARLSGVTLEIRGAPARELAGWLWDFDARPLDAADRAAAAATARKPRAGFGETLYKTPGFDAAHPFGTVPAAFSPDGRTGIFESNSIMRAVARLGADSARLYGKDAYEAARIDSFLDVSLVFARDSQVYLLALRNGPVPPDVHFRAREAFTTWMVGLERALAPDRRFLVGKGVTLADICFAAELGLFANELANRDKLAKQGLVPILNDGLGAEYPRALAHFARLRAHPAFAPDVAPYLEKLAARAGTDVPGPPPAGNRRKAAAAA